MEVNNPKTIEIREGKKIHIIELNRISYFEAAGKQTRVYFPDKTFILSTRMLKHYHDQLHKKGFYRIHRKTLINIDHIEKYDPKTGQVTLYSEPVPLIHYGGLSDAVN
jgi:DNA-binding LytR/AlgR family response regulator